MTVTRRGATVVYPSSIHVSRTCTGGIIDPEGECVYEGRDGRLGNLILQRHRPFRNTFRDHEVIYCAIDNPIIGEPACIMCDTFGGDPEA